MQINVDCNHDICECISVRRLKGLSSCFGFVSRNSANEMCFFVIKKREIQMKI